MAKSFTFRCLLLPSTRKNSENFHTQAYHFSVDTWKFRLGALLSGRLLGRQEGRRCDLKINDPEESNALTQAGCEVIFLHFSLHFSVLKLSPLTCLELGTIVFLFC